MSHEEIQLMLSAFADGELSQHDHDDMQQHLRQCQNCRQMMTEFERMRFDIRTAVAVELSPNFAANVLRAARRQADPQIIRNGADLFARRLVLALTIIVFFVVSVGSLNSSEPALVIEPGFSGVSVDSTAQQTLLQGEVSKEDILLAVMTR